MKVIYIQYALRDILFKLCSTYFSTEVQDDISYESSDIRIRLVRARDDRMTVEFMLLSMDLLFSIVIFNNTSIRELNSGFTLNRLEDDILYSCYSTEYNNKIVINNIVGLMSFEKCELDYPIRGDQYFQKSTIFPVPAKYMLDMFMGTGSYTMSNSGYKGYSFHINTAWLDTINETIDENMVQSLIEVVNGLIEVEKEKN